MIGLTIFVSSLVGWVDIDTLHMITKINKDQISHAMSLLEGIEKEAEGSWMSYYHVFPNLIKKYNLKKGIEIGVSTGGHSTKSLNLPMLKSYLALILIHPMQR